MANKQTDRKRVIRDAMQAALKACNYACHDCGRSYRCDGVRTKCHFRCFEKLEIAVLCADCRARQVEKAQTVGTWISKPVIVREADPTCTEEAPF